MTFDASKFQDPDSPDSVEAPVTKKFNVENFQDPDLEEMPQLVPAEPSEPTQLAEPPQSADPTFADTLSRVYKQARQTKESVKEGVTQGIQETGQGVKQLFLEGAEALNLADEGATQRYTEKVKRQRQKIEQEISKLPIEQQAMYKGSRFLGGVLPYAALPGGMAGGILKRMAIGGVTGGVIGGTQLVEKEGRRFQNALLGGILGGALPGLQGIWKGTRAIGGRLLGTKKSKVREIAKVMSPREMKTAKKGMLAARKLGTQLTPGEAAVSKIIKAKEKAADVIPKTQAKVKQLVEKREAVLKKTTKEVLEGVTPKADKVVKEQAKQLYKKVDEKIIPQSQLKEIVDDPIIAKARESAHKNPDWGLTNVKKGSMKEMRKVKEFLDKKVEVSAAETKKGTPNFNLSKARDRLRNFLDDISPDYKEARKLSQSLINKRFYEDSIAKIPLEAGQQGPTVSQIYRKLFNTPQKQKAIIKSVKEAGGDVKQVANMLRVMSRIEKSPLESLLGKPSALTEKIARGKAESTISTLTRHFLTRKHQKSMIDLMTNPKWAKQVEKLVNIKGPVKLYKNVLESLKRAAAVKAVIPQEREGPKDINPEFDPANPLHTPERLEELKKMSPQEYKKQLFDSPKGRLEVKKVLGKNHPDIKRAERIEKQIAILRKRGTAAASKRVSLLLKVLSKVVASIGGEHLQKLGIGSARNLERKRRQKED